MLILAVQPHRKIATAGYRANVPFFVFFKPNLVGSRYMNKGKHKVKILWKI